jgi:hypothetical protein
MQFAWRLKPWACEAVQTAFASIARVFTRRVNIHRMGV